MIRTVFAATKMAKRTSTSATINPTIPASSIAYQRCRALDLHDVHTRARLDDVVLVVRARGPHLALDAHLAHAVVVDDALGDDPRAPDEGRRPGAQLRRHGDVAPRDRAHDGEAHAGQHDERDPRDRRFASRQPDDGGPRGAD